MGGKLVSCLDGINQQAEELFLRLVNQMAKQVTENLKAADQMAWVGRMNNIHERAVEIINAELICI